MSDSSAAYLRVRLYKDEILVFLILDMVCLK